VLVAGAGVWGAYIADHLTEQGHQVVIVEQDAATVRRARSGGDRRTIIHGDACEPAILDLVGLQTVDTVVAATGDDEDNLVISLLCRRLWSVPRTVARVNNPKNTWLFTQDWGVDSAVSAPELLTHLLDAGMGVQDVVTMLRTERGGIALVEVTLDEDAPAVGHRVAELPLPEGSAVVAVVRDEQVLPGGGPTPLAPGDEVLAVTILAVEPTLRRVLGGLSGGSHTPVG
jgi:trk system potassium uptake protein